MSFDETTLTRVRLSSLSGRLAGAYPGPSYASVVLNREEHALLTTVLELARHGIVDAVENHIAPVIAQSPDGALAEAKLEHSLALLDLLLERSALPAAPQDRGQG